MWQSPRQPHPSLLVWSAHPSALLFPAAAASGCSSQQAEYAERAQGQQEAHAPSATLHHAACAPTLSGQAWRCTVAALARLRELPSIASNAYLISALPSVRSGQESWPEVVGPTRLVLTAVAAVFRPRFSAPRSSASAVAASFLRQLVLCARVGPSPWRQACGQRACAEETKRAWRQACWRAGRKQTCWQAGQQPATPARPQNSDALQVSTRWATPLSRTKGTVCKRKAERVAAVHTREDVPGPTLGLADGPARWRVASHADAVVARSAAAVCAARVPKIPRDTRSAG
jgi:hypothetical protein